uniref:Uncharacterized protein n=1 Tax=Anguilla anguilla TaxID=7936 RepID=A0A0E9PRC3_ANGAN
MNSSGALCPPL